MYRSLLSFFSKNAALKTTVIPLSSVFTRISAVALITPLQCGAYMSNYGNLQLKSLLHLGQNVITFRTLLHLGQNVITFRTLLHLGLFITFRPSTSVPWRQHFANSSFSQMSSIICWFSCGFRGFLWQNRSHWPQLCIFRCTYLVENNSRVLTRASSDNEGIKYPFRW